MRTVAPHPSTSFSATLRVHLDDQPGAFAAVAAAVARAADGSGVARCRRTPALS